MPNVVYNEWKKRLLGAAAGSVNLSALKVMLLQSSYVVDPDHAALDDGTSGDPLSHELSVSGYARQTLAGVAAGKDVSVDFGYLDANDVVFLALGAGQTIGGVLIYLDTGVDTTSVPAMFYAPTVPTPTNGSDITIQWATIANGGVLKAV